MKNNPKISIIIPAFNEENLLPGCLETISLQDYPNFEVIVVDNASADKTKEIILSYTENFHFSLMFLPARQEEAEQETPA